MLKIILTARKNNSLNISPPLDMKFQDQQGTLKLIDVDHIAITIDCTSLHTSNDN